MNALLHNRQKMYTVFFIAFSAVPSLQAFQKMKSRQKGGNKSVTRLRPFAEVPTKSENTNNSLFLVILLRIHLESISDREERRPLLLVIIGFIISRWLLSYSL